MSTSDTDLDLELHFLPAWAKKAPDQNRYEHFKGEVDRPQRETGPRRDRGRGGPQRQDRPPRGAGRPRGEHRRGHAAGRGEVRGSCGQGGREVGLHARRRRQEPEALATAVVAAGRQDRNVITPTDRPPPLP